MVHCVTVRWYIIRWAEVDNETSMIVNNAEIMECSTNNISDHIDPKDDEFDNNNESISSVSFDSLIASMDKVISWAEESLPLNDIFMLRRVREKMYSKRLNLQINNL